MRNNNKSTASNMRFGAMAALPRVDKDFENYLIHNQIDELYI